MNGIKAMQASSSTKGRMKIGWGDERGSTAWTASKELASRKSMLADASNGGLLTRPSHFGRAR